MWISDKLFSHPALNDVERVIVMHSWAHCGLQKTRRFLRFHLETTIAPYNGPELERTIEVLEREGFWRRVDGGFEIINNDCITDTDPLVGEEKEGNTHVD